MQEEDRYLYGSEGAVGMKLSDWLGILYAGLALSTILQIAYAVAIGNRERVPLLMIEAQGWVILMMLNQRKAA